MFPQLITSQSKLLRVKIRVKKWRAHPKGWTPIWRAIVSVSALVSILLCFLFLFLLLQLLLAEDPWFFDSVLSPINAQWHHFAGSEGTSITAVPEPSRCIMILIAMLAILFRRCR